MSTPDVDAIIAPSALPRGDRTLTAAVPESGASWISAAAVGNASVPLPVAVPLRGLFDEGGLPRGQITTVTGSTSLVLALVATPSAAGAWCAMVGLERLGLAAAGQAGVSLDRLVLLPRAGAHWPEAVAALVESFAIVVVRVPAPVTPKLARGLQARARRHGTVLLSVRTGPQAPSLPGQRLELAVVDARWEGLGHGHGRLRTRLLDVRVTGHGAASRHRLVRLRLHDARPDHVEPVDENGDGMRDRVEAPSWSTAGRWVG